MEQIKTKFTVKTDGFFGEIFKSKESNSSFKDKILIICPGSTGDFDITTKVCMGISKCGIDTLGINYSYEEDTPDTLSKVPIDYIENAAKYLKSIGYEKIGIWGISFGAIYSLLCGVYLPDLISLVVAASPLHFVIQAQDSNKNISLEGSSFSYQGKEIPFEPFKEKMTFFKNFYNTIKNLEPNLYYLYEPMMDIISEEHIIPVEKMKARIILFSGKIDNLWPSHKACELIMKRLKEHNYSYPYEHIVCEHGSHLMVPLDTMSGKFFKACRKYPEETAKYKEEHYNKLVETFKIW